MDFETLTKVCGKNIPAGSKAKLYIQRDGAFDGFPEEAVEGDKILAGTFAFVAGGPQAFAEIPIIVDSGAFKDTLVGNEPGSQGIENMIDFRIAGNSVEQLKFADILVAHSGCIVAILEMKNGDRRVLGTPDIPAVVDSFEGNSGQKQGDPNNQIWTLKCSLGKTAPILAEATVVPVLAAA